ncbi:MAG: NAD(P)H-hydrate epimerase [Thermoleophilia bacterium]|nr:NAD(P)H-hydrate epimerase [Thermoleophilia bacterium]
MQHGAALARESGDAALAEAVASGRFAGYDPRLRALLDYACKLTRHPEAMVEADLERLREAGLDDRAIVDANQVVAYYNYVNRVADGLGVELEDEWPEELRGEAGYSATVPAAELPWLDIEQMRELDRIAVDEFGLTLERMMENAGRNLAELARRLLGGRVAGRSITVLAGPGGNGGGGLVAARHLANAGAEVTVVLSHPRDRLRPVTAAQLHILEAMKIAPGGPPDDVELVLDALLGYSQEGSPRGGAARLIEWSRGRRVLSLDLPSGLLHEPRVEAEATLTLAAPKRALRGGAAGTLYVADLSIPPAAYARAGIPWRSPFETAPLVRIV